MQNRKKLLRRLITAGIFLALAGFLAFAFRPQPLSVDIASISRGELVVSVDEEGETRAREVYTVSTPITGRLLRIDLEVGDPVIAAETIVARILPSNPAFLDERAQAQAEAGVKSADAALSLARADLNRVQAEVDFARNELRRGKRLFASNTISEAALDRYQLSLRTSQAALETARAAVGVRSAELENAKAMLVPPRGSVSKAPGDGNSDGNSNGEPETGGLPVYAPVSGQVLRLPRKSETIIVAGQPLVEIGDTAELEIVTDLLSTDAVRVKEGAGTQIIDWGGDYPLKGQVQRIEPFGFTKVSALGIEEQRVNVVIDFLDPPARRTSLGHGFRVETRIDVWRSSDVLKIPSSALFRHHNRWSAFAISNGHAVLKHLDIGHSNGREAEIIDGLTEGEQVILHPGDRVEDGLLVVSRTSE